MKQLFVLSDTAIKGAGASVNPTDLTAGQLGIFENGESKASVPAGAEVQIAVGLGGGDCYITKPYKAGSASVKTQIAYAAGSKHIAEVTPVRAAISADTDEYIVKVIDTTTGKRDVDYKTYTVSGVFASDTLLCDALVAQINADADAIVVATNVAGVLTLTAKEFNAHFRIALQEYLEGEAVTYTPFAATVGTPEMVAAIEKECNTYQGNTDGIYAYSKSAPSLVSGNYDLYHVVVDTPVKDKSGMNGFVSDRSEFYIAIPDGASAVNPAGVASALANL